MSKQKNIPVGLNVSVPLRGQIIALLRKYAGADNPMGFNFTLIMWFAVRDGFAKYLADNPCTLLFGETGNEKSCPLYYPLCMYAYYGEINPNRAMFRGSSESYGTESDEIPRPEDVMSWFYEKHKEELIGLI